MRFLTAVVLTLALGGCALFPSVFDAQEHARLVTISQLSADNKVCANPNLAASVSLEIVREADWLYRYGSSLRDNQNMISMEQNLLAISRELQERYVRGDVSVVYCRLKLDNIHSAAGRIMAVSARRPRL